VGLEKTFNSIKMQKNKSWQNIIVISKDDNFLSEYLKIIQGNKKVKFLSQSKTGIYNAMNTGLYNSDKQFVMFLNGGDVFVNEYSLDQALQAIKYGNNAWYIFDYSIVDIGSDRVQIINLPNHVSKKDLISTKIRLSHQAVIYDRRNLMAIGGFNENLKIAADYESYYKMFSCSEPSVLNINFTVREIGGISSQKPYTVLYEYYKIKIQNGQINALVFFKETLRFIYGLGRTSLRIMLKETAPKVFYLLKEYTK
jgi:glycosyltransferase involved in cell wall biosynthesis